MWKTRPKSVTLGALKWGAAQLKVEAGFVSRSTIAWSLARIFALLSIRLNSRRLSGFFHVWSLKHRGVSLPPFPKIILASRRALKRTNRKCAAFQTAILIRDPSKSSASWLTTGQSVFKKPRTWMSTWVAWADCSKLESCNSTSERCRRLRFSLSTANCDRPTGLW